MADTMFDDYLAEINKFYTKGESTEHTYRPALKTLIESIDNKLTATNEAKRVDCGAPDFTISRRQRRVDRTIGYIECKDIGIDLVKAAKTEQIKDRYLKSFDNLLLTDYIEFRLYLNGEHHLTAKLAEESGGKFKTTPERIEKVALLLRLFFDHEGQRITTAKILAVKMAGIAKLLREIIGNAFSHEQQTGTLHSQFAAFKEVLLHDLTEEQFADMYAQTICYGLFSARCHIDDIILFGKDPHAVFHGIDEKSKTFSRQTAWELLPKTNPFLRKMFNHIAGPDLDDRIAWLVDELVELLQLADMASVLHDFARQSGKRDPVVHFYETFLSEYDKKLKKSRGVYYTPDPVVSYIVRSVDILLKEKFGLKRGLADDSKIKGTDQHKVLILDPAVGTGTFLFEVINQIHDKFKGNRGKWSSYVKDNLLPRIFGFELMMAPYTICHMKLGLQLAETGYEFDSDDRLGVYLTNTLEEAEEKAQTLFAQWIAEEAREANDVKRVKPVMVVTGNPPYSGISANKNDWTEKLLKEKLPIKGGAQSYYEIDGKPLGEKKVWLQDDYVKFIRFAQWRVELTGYGILAFITNHGYLDNPTFRGMRQSLMQTFDEIYILDLHGNQKKKETCPDGSRDVNVFDIQQGVSIGIFAKYSKNKESAKVYHYERFGLRDDKYKWLMKNSIDTTTLDELSPNSPYYFFVPKDEKSRKEYDEYPSITQIMPKNVTGIVTARDSIVIDINKIDLEKRISEFRDLNIDDSEIRQKYFSNKSQGKYPLGDTRGWKLPNARQELSKDEDWKKKFSRILYRPFDVREIYYSENMVDWPRKDMMQHMFKGGNFALITARSNKSKQMDHFFCSKYIAETKCGESTTQSCFFPVYLYPTEKNTLFDESHWSAGKDGRVPNLIKEFVDEFAAKVNLEFVSDGRGDLIKTFGPEDVFHYIYAVLHSPEYRKRYAEFLKIDFPRIPLPTGRTIFKKLCKVGAELSALHLMESEKLDDDKLWPGFDIEGDNTVEKGYPKYIGNAESVDKGKVYINKEQYFEGITPDVWEFHIGGYKVCEKWLKDRRGRTLSCDDITHYQKITVALSETIRLMQSSCLSELFEKSVKS